jgi:hypothetical protein
MNVDDLYGAYRHHYVDDDSPFPDGRQMLQVPFVSQLQGYTATRPGAILFRERNSQIVPRSALDDPDEPGLGDGLEPHDLVLAPYPDSLDKSCRQSDKWGGLCYRHVSLVLLPNETGHRDVIAMEVDLRFVKGWVRKPTRYRKSYMWVRVHYR